MAKLGVNRPVARLGNAQSTARSAYRPVGFRKSCSRQRVLCSWRLASIRKPRVAFFLRSRKEWLVEILLMRPPLARQFLKLACDQFGQGFLRQAGAFHLREDLLGGTTGPPAADESVCGSRASTPATAPSAAPTRDNPPPPTPRSARPEWVGHSSPHAAAGVSTASRAAVHSTAGWHTSGYTQRWRKTRSRSLFRPCVPPSDTGHAPL